MLDKLIEIVEKHLKSEISSDQNHNFTCAVPQLCKKGFIGTSKCDNKLEINVEPHHSTPYANQIYSESFVKSEIEEEDLKKKDRVKIERIRNRAFKKKILAKKEKIEHSYNNNIFTQEVQPETNENLNVKAEEKFEIKNEFIEESQTFKIKKKPNIDENMKSTQANSSQYFSSGKSLLNSLISQKK